jgi:hypothetical protein
MCACLLKFGELFWLCVQHGLRTAKLKHQKEYSSRKYERTAFATKDNDVMVFDSGQGIFRCGRFGDELSVLQTKEGAV